MTPTSSTAVAVIVTLPVTVPADGLASTTVGAVTSFRTFTITVVAVVSRPAASRATALNAWAALVTPVVGHST